jgi:hypothetical protein
MKDASLNHAIIDPPGKTGPHRVFVLLYSRSKRLEFGKFAALHLIKPVIKLLSGTCAQHLGKLLNQVIGPIDFRVHLTEFGQRLLLLDTQFFRATKQQKKAACRKVARAGAFDEGKASFLRPVGSKRTRLS